MTSITFPPAVGGDGSTVSDDNSPSTGLGNGGHRTRFVPALAQLVAIAQYVAAAAGAVPNSIFQPVRAAATANITLSGAQTVDGVALVAGDRCAVPLQTTASARGIYIVAAGAWTRATDADTSAEFAAGKAFEVMEGTVNGGTLWVHTTAAPITLGTTSLTFERLPSQSKANIWAALQTFSISPVLPTPAAGNNTTSGATTAFVQAALGGILTKSVAGGANVTLTAAEAGLAILVLTGALTANINVIVPTSPTSRWLVVNNTTGVFTLTVKTAAGTGVVVPQAYSQQIYNDSSNVYPIGPAINSAGDTVIGSGTGNNHVVNGNSTQTGQAIIGAAAVGQGTIIGGNGVELAAGTTVDVVTNVDFHARAGSDFDARIIRGAGANGIFSIEQTGASGIDIRHSGNTKWASLPTGDFSRVIPGGSTLYPDFACRAWADLTGAGATNAAGNIATTRTGVGLYVHTFPTAMPDINMAISYGSGTDNVDPRWVTKSPTGFTTSMQNTSSGARVDGPFAVHVVR